VSVTEPGRRAPAPEPLRLVQELINTVDLEDGRESLGDPGALAAWLAARGLLPAGASVGPADLRRARALREALRELAAAHNGLEADVAAATAQVNAIAARARVEPVLDADGATRLRARRGGLDGALGAVVAAVHAAAADGMWGRLKACERGHCRWAFYDASRNRSGRWCAMAVCGSREKSLRAYRRAKGR
jgi:predicted RNA-binding Zn ribbon-like protein